MTWTVSASGAVAADGTEQTLTTDTNNASFVALVDLSNMASGDAVEIRLYTKLLSTSALPRLAWKGTFSAATFMANATASFTTASTSISVAAGLPIFPGMAIYDLSGATAPIGLVGTVQSYSGTTVTLVAAALANSSGSTDTLSFGMSVAQSPFVPSDQSLKATLKQVGPQYAAGASWTTGTTITMSLSNPGGNGIVAGTTVIDLTTGQTIGTVSSWSGTTLTLQAGAAHASSGSADTLMFVNLKSFEWKLLRQ